MVAFATDMCVGDGASQGALPPTHPDEHLTALEERNRTLELSKYFAASQIVSPYQAAIGDENIAAAPSAPSADTTLTALAQLGTFKLSCDRAFISLINNTHQYIISEATQSTSLLDNALRPEDGLCLGVRALELAFGVCPQTMQIFTSDDSTICTPNVYADRTRYVIKDFTADPHFKSRPYVKGWPHMRSYAEVPLKSASGYVVGSYCVVDTRPRTFDDSEIQVLDSVGVTIMNHLELLKSQLEFHRVQRLVRGIGSYAAGHSGLQEHQTRTSPGTSASTSLLQPVEDAKSLPLRLVRGKSVETVTRPGMQRVHTDETVASPPDASMGTSVKSNTTEPTSESSPSDASKSRADAASITDYSTSSDHGETAFSKAAFSAVSRASYLVRQSMDLAGVVFVKPHESFGAPSSSVTVSTADGQDLGIEGPNCAVIGHSVDVNRVQGTARDAPGFALSPNLLQRLLKRYPFGHIFSYDDLGAVFQPHPGKDGQERRHPSQVDSQYTEDLAGLSEAEDAADLLKAAKGARSIAFTTLWDYRNDKWFAASISWTIDPLRIFDAGELNYLSAFGNSITAEVSRLEVSALSKAKSDFISSISHEMRSPLHGILAGTEILRETMKLEAEVSMLNSIDACGSMLLDTINHLLDYSKITNLSRRRQNHPSDFPKDSESNAGEFPVVNLSTLVHDVVEGVFLGNVASDNASDRDTSDDAIFVRNLRQGNSDQITMRMTETGDMVTLIDIDHSVDWRFKTEAAAWKRIVMNLFGNAMKFTKKGQINVRLRLERRSSAEGDIAQHVCVDVHDTGIGIDKGFLKSHLFTPFSQANDISVGTGVGLSIVKRLVEELNGSIGVQSGIGLGTHVCVNIPIGEMTFPVNGPESLLREDIPIYANGRYKGHTLYVQNLALKPQEAEQDRSTKLGAATTTNADSNMRSFFANLARQGFGMSVVELASLDESQQPSEGSSSHPISLNRSTSGGAWTLSRPACGAGDNATAVRIRQPFGPQTFASALGEIMAFTAAGAESVDDVSAVEKAEGKREREREHDTRLSTSPQVEEERRALSPLDDQEQDQHPAHAIEKRDNTPHTKKSKPQTPDDKESPSSSSTSSSKTAPHLLLVDDNAVNLKVLAAAVKKGGCTFDQAADGRQAVDTFKFSPAPYDLVFMDLSMPVMDGVQATREIREFEEDSAGSRKKRVKIIALTALDEDKHRQWAFEAGVDDFITKPVKMARVRELAKAAWGG